MKHQNVLLEHWEPFVRFLEENTDMLDGINLKEWLAASHGHEAERINEWMNSPDGFDLSRYLQQYFNSIARKTTETCIQCRRNFKQTDPPVCIKCGFGVNFLTILNAQDQLQAFETMQLIHVNRLALTFERTALELIWSQMDEEACRYSQHNNDYPTKEAALKSEIQQLQTDISRHEIEEHHLLQQKEETETHIRVLYTRLKQSDSLFKQYNTNRNPQNRIQLMSEGTKLMARPLNNTKFPIDLVTSFHRNLPDGPLRTAIFYIILPKEIWQGSDSTIWSLDLNQVVSGKVAGSFYLKFSSMQRNGEQIDVDYNTKTPVFIG